MTTPLLFLFDLETTGLDVDEDRITEIASKVFNSSVNVSKVSFESLVYTPHPIPENVQQVTGITADMLKDKDPFSVVLHKFLKWVSSTTQEVSEQTGCTYHTVLVAHNGFEFDCPLLFAEIEQTAGLDTSILENIYFSDTLFCLRQERDKIDFLKDQSLGLKSIHMRCFPDKPYNAHRAMPDVEAMEEVLQHPQVSFIQEALVLNQRPASEMLSTWSSSKKTREKEREQANNKATDT